MESKKDIGNYFKENLEQLDFAPSQKVWDGIEVKLLQKRKRRFAFWLLFASIVTGTILIAIHSYDFNSLKSKINTHFITDNNSFEETITTQVEKTNSNATIMNKVDTTVNKKSAIIYESKKESLNKMVINSSEKSLIEINNLDIKEKSGEASLKNASSTIKSKTAVTLLFHKDKLKTNTDKKLKHKTEQPIKIQNTSASENSTKILYKEDKKFVSKNLLNGIEESSLSHEKNKVTDSTLETFTTHKIQTEHVEAQDRKTSLGELKKSNQNKTDSIITLKKAEKEKKIETENPKDEEKKDTSTINSTKQKYEIIVAPYLGMNYTGNLGNGNFLNNSKSSKTESEFKASYGILIRIMGSKKLGLQIGGGIINSAYSSTFTKESANFISSNTSSLTTSLQELNNLFPDNTKVTSRQETTFIEVPLEAYYVLSDTKFGLATSFGISFLNLYKNELFLESETISKMNIGKLDNIVPFSSSINIKFNMFYKITSKLNFDLYPSLQYQINGYKDISNYHPYFFSIKTGLSYKL